jgi:hypothetical protein
MTKLQWDQTGERTYETGVDHGVLYEIDVAGEYSSGVAWNGLTTVTESPSGAEASPQYADNIKYLNLVSVEMFGATIEAFTYPVEFEKYDGNATPTSGVTVGQQTRKPFGFSYRTRKGNDVEAADYGYKLHLVYGCLAAPSEKAYATINDSPEAIAFSWELTTNPVQVGTVGGTDYLPTASITIDSTKVDPAKLAILEAQLYGDESNDPSMPLPADVITMMSTTTTLATPVAPTFNSGTETITIPTVTGVRYTINGEDVAAGPVVITEDTLVVAYPVTGYHFPAVVDTDWFFDYTP